MQAIRLFTLILPLFLALCAGIPASASTPSGSISSANTAITTHDNNGNLLPNALRIQYDVDSDGRVQNVKILESTTTPEFEHKIIEKMMSKTLHNLQKINQQTSVRISFLNRRRYEQNKLSNQIH
ncbi:TPA: energy transducer TonB [Klebsiella pneumoniae]